MSGKCIPVCSLLSYIFHKCRAVLVKLCSGTRRRSWFWWNVEISPRRYVSQRNVIFPALLSDLENVLVYFPGYSAQSIKAIKDCAQVGILQRFLFIQ